MRRSSTPSFFSPIGLASILATCATIGVVACGGGSKQKDAAVARAAWEFDCLGGNITAEDRGNGVFMVKGCGQTATYFCRDGEVKEEPLRCVHGAVPKGGTATASAGTSTGGSATPSSPDTSEFTDAPVSLDAPSAPTAPSVPGPPSPGLPGSLPTAPAPPAPPSFP